MLNGLLHLLAIVLLAGLVISLLGTLLLPIYLWVQWRDAHLAPLRAAEQAEIDRLLADES